MVERQSGRLPETQFVTSAKRLIKNSYWKYDSVSEQYTYDYGGHQIDVGIVRNERDWAEPDLAVDFDLVSFAIRQLAHYSSSKH